MNGSISSSNTRYVFICVKRANQPETEKTRRRTNPASLRPFRPFRLFRPSVPRVQLEQALEAKLPEPREVGLSVRGSINRAELCAIRIGVVGALVVHWRVEDIVRLGAKLESHPFIDAERLGEVQIELLERRA